MQDWEVGQGKESKLKAAEETALLCITEKKDIVHKLQVCPLHAIHYLVTEMPSTEKQFSRYRTYCKIL